MGALYKITFPNGKAYIGVTVDTAAYRFGEHRRNARAGGRYALHRALRKHSAPTLSTLVVADDWKYLCDLERRAIAAYGTFGPGGYNMTAGGEGALGYRHDAETLKRMGAVHKGKAHHNMPHSPEARAKMSAARRGKKRVLSAEQRARLVASMKGNTFGANVAQSAETRRKRALSVMAAGKGVCWDARTQKWRAHITIAGKMKDLGRFANEGDALAARAAAVAQRMADA